MEAESDGPQVRIFELLEQANSSAWLIPCSHRAHHNRRNALRYEISQWGEPSKVLFNTRCLLIFLAFKMWSQEAEASALSVCWGIDTRCSLVISPGEPPHRGSLKQTCPVG